MLLIKIVKTVNYKQGIFENQQTEHLKNSCELVKESFREILQAAQEIYVIFKDGSKEVQQEWKRFTESIDQIIEEAMKNTILQSLQNLSSAINGNSLEDQQALFHVRVLLDSSIEFRPTMIDLTNTINRITKELIGIVRFASRVTDSLNTSNKINEREEKCKDSNQETLHLSISTNESVLKLINQIMNGTASMASSARKQLHIWEKYKPLWEMDKESFLRRYSKSNLSPATFERDINHHKNEKEKIEIEESNTYVYFIRLDFSNLKASLMSHNIEWQNRLTEVFHKNGFEKLRKSYSIFHSLAKKYRKSISGIDNQCLNNDILKDMSTIKNDFDTLEATYRSLNKFDFQMSSDEIEMIDSIRRKWKYLQEVADESVNNIILT